MPPAITFTLETDVGVMRPGVDNEVTPSSRRLFLQSTMSPYCESRSSPMISNSTSAVTKRQVKSRRRPAYRV